MNNGFEKISVKDKMPDQEKVELRPLSAGDNETCPVPPTNVSIAAIYSTKRKPIASQPPPMNPPPFGLGA